MDPQGFKQTPDTWVERAGRLEVLGRVQKRALDEQVRIRVGPEFVPEEVHGERNKLPLHLAALRIQLVGLKLNRRLTPVVPESRVRSDNTAQEEQIVGLRVDAPGICPVAAENN